MENEIIENSDEMDTEAEIQDEDQVVDEVEDTEMEAEAEVEVEVDPISELIGSIEAKDYVAANTAFNDMLGQRLQIFGSNFGI